MANMEQQTPLETMATIEHTPSTSEETVATPLIMPPITTDAPTQLSAFFLLPGELRNKIYSHLLDASSANPMLFHEAHQVASACRLLRSEFWPYYMQRATFKLNFSTYADFITTFFPPADPDVMRRYVGILTFTMEYKGASYTREVHALTAETLTLSLQPLIGLLRASPHVHVRLDADKRWLCRRKHLKAFLQYAREAAEWVAVPLVESLTLRLGNAQMARADGARTFWIVDVRLKRDLRFVYEQVGLLAYLEMRRDEGREGVTFFVSWGGEEVMVPGEKSSWVGKVKKHVVKGLGELRRGTFEGERRWRERLKLSRLIRCASA